MSDTEIIKDNGIIDEMVLPESFYPAYQEEPQPHHYLEYQAKGSCALICYEQTSEPFINEDIEKVETLLLEDPGEEGVRQIDTSCNPARGHDDCGAFDVLSFCFVFGGGLTRNSTVMDIDRCTWEIRRLDSEDEQSKNVIIGRLKFTDSMGRRSKRELIVVVPRAPSENGCGYLWLEGNASELKRYERGFIASVASAKLREPPD